MLDQKPDRQRIDKWLWAARMFKTRSQAANACDGGHVRLNEMAAKPAKAVRPGDIIEIRREGDAANILELFHLSELSLQIATITHSI